MSLRIATNIQALAAQRSFSQNRAEEARSRGTLSSGNRIHSASDDVAGLSISSKIYASMRSGKQAIRNTMDGVSIAQVADGALNEIGNILVRFRELSIQAASDTIGNEERNYLNKELQSLKSEIDRIAVTTEFNGVKILKGNLRDLEVQIGIHNDEFSDRAIFASTYLAQDAHSLGVFDISVGGKEDARENLFKIDYAMSQLNDSRAIIGAFQNQLLSQVNNMMISNENLSAAHSRISDVDYAMESANLAKYDILVQSSLAMISQGNVTPKMALNLLK